ncbi:MAG: YihY/virulence factor BrkB family protein [Chromatiales bacterium]|nr:YihY/virulence factor BrkB family protein [Chromatiales bacterium]
MSVPTRIRLLPWNEGGPWLDGNDLTTAACAAGSRRQGGLGPHGPKPCCVIRSLLLQRVLSGVRRHQVFLLAGAVAYYTLLSLIPMLALILVVLSQLVEPGRLLAVTHDYLGWIAPGLADTLTGEIGAFIANWPVIGAVGVAALALFSSLAFTVLENAMSVIFYPPRGDPAPPLPGLGGDPVLLHPVASASGCWW